jgi:hypothetical protein
MDLDTSKKVPKIWSRNNKIAKVTTNGTRRLNWTTRQNGHLWPIFGGIGSVGGLKYISTHFIYTPIYMINKMGVHIYVFK